MPVGFMTLCVQLLAEHNVTVDILQIDGNDCGFSPDIDFAEKLHSSVR